MTVRTPTETEILLNMYRDDELINEIERRGYHVGCKELGGYCE